MLYFPGVPPIPATLTKHDLLTVRSYMSEGTRRKGRPKELSEEMMFKFVVMQEHELFGGTWDQIMTLVCGDGKKPTTRQRQKRLIDFHKKHKSYIFLDQKMRSGEPLTQEEQADLYDWWAARHWVHTIDWMQINPLRKDAYVPSREPEDELIEI